MSCTSFDLHCMSTTKCNTHATHMIPKTQYDNICIFKQARVRSTIKQKINTVYMLLFYNSAIYMKKYTQTKQERRSICTQLVQLVASFVLVCLVHQWFLTYDRLIGRVHRHQPPAPVDFLISDKTCTPALRLIVLTMNRTESLHRLLAVLARVHYGGECVALDVCIERSAQGELDAGTVAVAHSVVWPFGPKAVHTRGRFFDAWGRCMSPGVSNTTRETALIFEHHVEVSDSWFRDSHQCPALRHNMQSLIRNGINTLCELHKKTCFFKWIAHQNPPNAKQC